MLVFARYPTSQIWIYFWCTLSTIEERAHTHTHTYKNRWVSYFLSNTKSVYIFLLFFWTNVRNMFAVLLAFGFQLYACLHPSWLFSRFSSLLRLKNLQKTQNVSSRDKISRSSEMCFWYSIFGCSFYPLLVLWSNDKPEEK